MPSNALILRNPPRGVEDPRPQVVVDALIHLIQNQFPAIISGAAISAALIQQVVDFVKKNLAILGGVLTTAGLTILLPSLTVALVNLVGFSASGVVSGSLAALIQSTVYAGSTGGMFSALQLFGATAAVAPPVALALGGTFLVIGIGAVGYWWYTRRQHPRDRGDSDDDDDKHPPQENQPLIKRPRQFNIFDISRRSPKD